jgi:hypothetical protein
MNKEYDNLIEARIFEGKLWISASDHQQAVSAAYRRGLDDAQKYIKDGEIVFKQEIKDDQ